MSSSRAALPPFVPPPGTNFLVVIDSAVNFLLIGATMGSVLLAMLLALLFFSTKAIRRKPIFVLNVIAVLLGILQAIVTVYAEVHTLKYPTVRLGDTTSYIVAALEGYTPTFVDAILFFRLYSVYPRRTTSRAKFCAILGIPVLVTIGRVANATIYIVNYADTLHKLVIPNTANAKTRPVVDSPSPCVKIEWSLQVFIDVYSSAIFLYRVYLQSSWQSRTVSDKVKALFWISVSNFVFPVILGIVQLAIYVARPDIYILAVYVEVVNFHFTIMGVVLATVWMAEERWADARGMNEDPARASLSRESRPATHDKPKETLARGNITLPRSLLSITQ
ncbi:hypothetical protein PLICRDRAFT_696089 [Plicaturopsis crispa FD-325 SS-3]|nr:hypothetical protein PLICRDRAFT_696089 [Plicaturopsis crispa FD-325 SS-3]